MNPMPRRSTLTTVRTSLVLDQPDARDLVAHVRALAAAATHDERTIEGELCLDAARTIRIVQRATMPGAVPRIPVNGLVGLTVTEKNGRVLNIDIESRNGALRIALCPDGSRTIRIIVR